LTTCEEAACADTSGACSNVCSTKSQQCAYESTYTRKYASVEAGRIWVSCVCRTLANAVCLAYEGMQHTLEHLSMLLFKTTRPQHGNNGCPACADPIVKAVQSAKKGIPIIPRVGSNARLEDCGGSAGQLVLGFVIKGVILGVVACTLAKYNELPIQLRDFLYSEYPHHLKCEHNSSACAPFIALKCIMAESAAQLACASVHDARSRHHCSCAGITRCCWHQADCRPPCNATLAHRNSLNADVPSSVLEGPVLCLYRHVFLPRPSACTACAPQACVNAPCAAC